MRISILADQLGAGAGGGRFTTGFLRALFSDATVMNSLEQVFLLIPEKQSVVAFEPLPAKVKVISRRFPSRLRSTPLARLFACGLPKADVAYGPFYFSFPGSARARVVTVHDLSCFDEQFHPTRKAQAMQQLIASQVEECAGLVCDSVATLEDLVKRWPQARNKARCIYLGVENTSWEAESPNPIRKNTLLAVGTIEPRKNYGTLLMAYRALCEELGNDVPRLIVIGNRGWMSETVEKELLALEDAGKCSWLRSCTDAALREAYATARAFTYLSLSEGFGYPPFEAAYAECPMVLSNTSSVGEIWSGYSKCVCPNDISEIVAAWKWALALEGRQLQEVVARQEQRARQFTWERTVREYTTFWKQLVTNDISN